jgi:hypothetical protein
MREASYEFTPRQVVTAVALIVLASVLLPRGVRAATGQIVNIVDPVYSGSQARVHSNGALRNVLTDPVQGAYAKVDGSSLRVGVPQPKTSLTRFATLATTTTTYMFTSAPFVANAVAGISSITLTNSGSVDARFRADYLNGLSGNCPSSTTSFSMFIDVKVPVGQTVHLTFPQPLTHTHGGKWCFGMSLYTQPGGAQLDVTAVGFTN